MISLEVYTQLVHKANAKGDYNRRIWDMHEDLIVLTNLALSCRENIKLVISRCNDAKV